MRRLNPVTKATYLGAVSPSGNCEELKAKHGIIFGPYGEKILDIRDGSPQEPISTPDMWKENAASMVMAQLSSGEWVAVQPPADSTGKMMLMWEAGAISFQPWGNSLNETVYQADQVQEAGCGLLNFAGWTQCEGSDTIRLVKVDPSAILNFCDAAKRRSLFDSIVGCDAGQISNMLPVEDYVLGAIKQPDGTFKWGPVRMPRVLTAGEVLKFRYTGGDQDFTVPEGVGKIKVKVWGAFGENNSFYAGGSAAGGGYTYGELPVVSGTQFKIMVGGRGFAQRNPQNPRNVIFPGPYGFGGGGGYNGISWFVAAGGGLSGIFTGNTAIAETDQARARLIAGGGAGSSIFGGVSAANEGGNGTGTQPTMRGATCPLASFGASGGGGYFGGNISPNGVPVGGGGTGYTHVSVQAAVIKRGAPNAHAEANDSDYEPSQNGLVVIELVPEE